MPTNDRRSQDRRSDDPRVTALVAQVASIEQRQEDLSRQLAINTAITAQVSQNTTDIIEVWTSVKSGMRVLGWLGAAARWVAIIASCITAVGAAVYAITHWGSPK